MKRTLIYKSTWQTVLSIVVLSIFVFMGAVTWGEATPKPVVTINPDGTATERKDYPRNGKSETTVGKWDKANKRFMGTVTITYTDQYTDVLGRETVNMKDGKRHGLGTYTHSDGTQDPICYQNGTRVKMIHCEDGSEKSAAFSVNNNSAYSIFSRSPLIKSMRIVKKIISETS